MRTRKRGIRRGVLIMGSATLLAGVVAAPAFAHATFPAAQNPLGSSASPYPASSLQTLILRVPEERAGPPKLDNVDVKVEIPAGWTNPVCQPAKTQVNPGTGNEPGPDAAGWSCSLEPGSPDVLHWSRPAGATDLGIYFPFQVTTPGTGGTYKFVVHQTYSGTGEVVDWIDAPVPDPNANPPVVCSTGTNTAGTACSKPAPTRVVAAGPPPVIPEAATPILLPIGAAVVLGTAAMVVAPRRRLRAGTGVGAN